MKKEIIAALCAALALVLLLSGCADTAGQTGEKLQSKTIKTEVHNKTEPSSQPTENTTAKTQKTSVSAKEPKTSAAENKYSDEKTDITKASKIRAATLAKTKSKTSKKESAKKTTAQTTKQNLTDEKTETATAAKTHTTRAATAAPQLSQNGEAEEETEQMKMNVNVNGRDFTATLEQNSASAALVQMMKSKSITLKLSDYGGFEKVGALGRSLPTSNRQITTKSGDIVLYQGNQIVMFYGSNSWSYTKLGHIDDLSGWKEALGRGDVTVTLSLKG
jgi:hypothetical protein